MKYGFAVSYTWYNFFQLGLVSQSDKHCTLYQGMITKWTIDSFFLSIGLSTVEVVRDKGPKSREHSVVLFWKA